MHGKEVEEPADGYPGEYVVEIAQRIVDEHGDRFLSLPEEQALPELGKLSVEIVIGWIRDDLAAINVHFDRWYYEQDLYDSGLFDRAMALLREQGHVAEREGAVWFTTTDLGDDKDNVLVRSNGAPTYFASDVAYHYDKFLLRGFDRVINVWAADHQGHVPRMKALAKALGIDPDRLTVALYQLVRLMKDGKPVRQGKRTGTFVALSEALEEIGPDALRFFLVAYSSNAPMDLDLDLARKEASENPVYYVQYGHARIASLLRRAEDLDYRAGKVDLLNDPTELALIRKMLMLPELVQTATEQLAPHHLPYYAVDLAKAFTAFYESCRVLGNEDQELTLARLKLSAACKQVLANALRLIGVSAPERMSREDS
jgi:arginyl-tRNA synthetase